MQNNPFDSENQNLHLKNEIIRYFSFWPFLLFLIFVFVFSAFTYLRYTDYKFQSNAVIEILDESQDSEMALPTELTVFNRSMINLENEINILKSYALNQEVVKKLKSNILYYDVGIIKTSLVTAYEWYDDYLLDFKVDTDIIKNSVIFSIKVDDKNLSISEYDKFDNLVNTITFNSLTTVNDDHNLPFELTVNSDANILAERILKIISIENSVNQMRRQVNISSLGKESDQLSLSIVHENPKIGNDYLNGLMTAFDQDGIKDRQLEYERTIQFVNKREKILKKELELVEIKKQNFKQANNLSDLTLDADNNINLKYTYNSEIFQSESQNEIANYLYESLNEKEYDYLPLNIGLENFDLNNMIIEYNKIVSERNKYLSEAGPNNFLVRSLQSQLDNLIKNISASLDNFRKSIELKIKNLKAKEIEFDNVYNRVPENEKILRSIERELSVKEALYLLLLQKREESAINLAVVKPSIKVIDYPIIDKTSKSPKPIVVYGFSIVFSFLLWIIIIYVRFFIDNKVHTKDDLSKLLDKDIPILSEVPYINNNSIKSKQLTLNADDRSVLNESIRMLLSNLKFVLKDNELCKTLLFTSSIKGEGKTLASVNTAINLSNDTNKRVLLIGADLRNPQIHKQFGVDKKRKGLSDLLYNDDLDNFSDYLSKEKNLDILYSGPIPPNPTSLLSSETFKKLITVQKTHYDYIIIDSAPCLLVSDTLQLVDYSDSVIYLFRANFTDSKIVDYINEHKITGRIKNLNIVFNGVGNSSSYGYRYGYQYGYKYGYKYGYNYGYGYGYSEDKS